MLEDDVGACSTDSNKESKALGRLLGSMAEKGRISPSSWGFASLAMAVDTRSSDSPWETAIGVVIIVSSSVMIIYQTEACNEYKRTKAL